MNTFMQMSSETLTMIIFFGIMFFVVKWLFIYLIIKSATKNAILEAYTFIKRTNGGNIKTPEEEMKEELEGWNQEKIFHIITSSKPPMNV